ncbi:hypothetical protein BH20ACT4_BH20ACT4_00300 [soil metagenome]
MSDQIDVEERPTAANSLPCPPATRRRIGPWGTAARTLVGVGLMASVVVGHATAGWRPVPWLLAVVVFPAMVLGVHWVRVCRGGRRVEANGPVGHGVNIAVFLALYLTTWYAPPLEATSDAALIFYGASMLLAAARGYAGCEVLAVSNWVLGRDDQVGCALFAPADHLEAVARHSPMEAEKSL